MNGFIIKNLWPAAKSFLHILMSRPLWTSHAFVVYASGAVRVYEWVCVHELVSAFLFVQVYLCISSHACVCGTWGNYGTRSQLKRTGVWALFVADMFPDIFKIAKSVHAIFPVTEMKPAAETT